jgi:predicted enzyme related to lactoylglutathione lyase
MELRSILIGSEEPKILVEYYSKLFGEPVWSEGDYTSWQFGAGWVTVGAHSEVKGKSAHPGRVIWDLESTDVKGDFERLKAAGATVVQEPYTMEGMDEGFIATFADPDGNYFQLTSPMPASPEGM